MSLSATLAKRPNAPVIIMGDKDVRYDLVVRVLEIAKSGGRGQALARRARCKQVTKPPARGVSSLDRSRGGSYTHPGKKQEACMDNRSKSALVTGTVLIVLGVFFLVTRFVPGFFETFSWPYIVIGVGVLFMLIAFITWTPGLAVPACIIGGIGGILYG